MKNNIVLLIIVAILAIGGIFFLTKNKSSNQSSPITGNKPIVSFGEKLITAKQAYSIALPEAKKFSPDSYLVDINTSRVQKDGRSHSWFIRFSSATKNSGFKVNVINGKVDQTDDSYKKDDRVVPDGWLDSDQVAKIAIPKCGAVVETDYFFGLDKHLKNRPAEWSVQCTVGENKTLIIDVDAVTGNYLKTRKAGIGW